MSQHQASIEVQIAQLKKDLENCCFLDETVQQVAKRNISKQIQELKRQNTQKTKRVSSTTPAVFTFAGQQTDPPEEKLKKWIEESKLEAAGTTLKITIPLDQQQPQLLRSNNAKQRRNKTTKHWYPSPTLEISDIHFQSTDIDLKTPGYFNIYHWRYQLATNPMIINNKSREIVDTRDMSIYECHSLLTNDQHMLLARPNCEFGSVKLREGSSFRVSRKEVSELKAILDRTINTVSVSSKLKFFSADNERGDSIEGVFIFEKDGVHAHFACESDLDDDQEEEIEGHSRYFLGPLYFKVFIPKGATKGSGTWWRSKYNRHNKYLYGLEDNIEDDLISIYNYLFPMSGSMDQYYESLTLHSRPRHDEVLVSGTCEVSVEVAAADRGNTATN